MNGVPRRYYRFDDTFDIFQHLDLIGKISSAMFFVFLFAQLLPIVNLFTSSKVDLNKKHQDNLLK